MEWWEAFLLIMGSLFFLMFIGMPVAFTFLVVNIVGAYFFFGGLPGMSQLVIQISDSLSTFTLVPVALFLVMGEIMFHSGIGVNLLDALDKWFGNLKGLPKKNRNQPLRKFFLFPTFSSILRALARMSRLLREFQ